MLSAALTLFLLLSPALSMRSILVHQSSMDQQGRWIAPALAPEQQQESSSQDSNRSGCGHDAAGLSSDPEKIAEQAKRSSIQWHVLQCLLDRAMRVGGGEHETERAQAVQLVHRIWTLEVQVKGGFGSSGEDFIQAFKDYAAYGMSLNQLVYDLRANDAKWELMTLLPQIAENDQMNGIAGFDYDAVSKVCEERAPMGQIESYVNQTLRELRSGCQGECNKYFPHTCRAATNDMCPEGTSCACARTWSKWAPAVYIVSYIGAWVAEAIFYPPAMALPHEPILLPITAVLASRYAGCICMANTCQYFKRSNSCGLALPKGVDRMRGYPTLPSLGTKCGKRTTDPDGKQCWTQRCSGEDFAARRVGQHGSEVFNCIDDFWTSFTLKPMRERFEVYGRLGVDKENLMGLSQ